ncbi:MAG TPA: hypothetical protein DEQ43_24310 [Nocardioides bacterium]|nr:hypothetical protein [Nocardioides sp.]
MPFVDDHLVRVWKTRDIGRGGELLTTLCWGDELAHVGASRAGGRPVTLPDGRTGYVDAALRKRSNGILQVAFVDVGQGDACIITTPTGKRLLIDAGENQQLARYLAARNRSVTAAGKTTLFDAVVLTHGDADHIAGLVHLVDAATETRAEKKIVFATRALLHNGLAKRPASTPSSARFGPTESASDGGRVVPLVEDPSSLPDSELNRHFRDLKRSIGELRRRHTKLEVRPLSRGENVNLGDISIVGINPTLEVSTKGAAGLRWLGSPAATVNGHSIVLKLVYGRARFLLGADLTRRTGDQIAADHAAGMVDVGADVLKVPHHGSSDISEAMLAKVAPVVSIISAGDEDARRDHLHPRATVLGAVARHAREPALVFVTNLNAFDRWRGRAFPAIESPRGSGTWVPDVAAGSFYARERTQAGVLHVRTDGEHLLVTRWGASPGAHESYVLDLKDAAPTAGRAVVR